MSPSADAPLTATAARCHAVVPCAGVGSRMGLAQPKQYASVQGLPVVQHTLRALRGVPHIERLVVVLAPNDRHAMGWPSDCEILRRGGATRADSVGAGLAHLLSTGAEANDWVLVHDAARCLATPALIGRLLEACWHDPVGGLLATPLADTLKRANTEGRAVETPSRDQLWLAQTPQMFRLGALHQALAEVGAGVTDEASAIQAKGLAPRLVTGDPSNIKITTPADLALAHAWLARQQETS